MRVLTLNCGSASLKFAVWDVGNDGPAGGRPSGTIAWSGSGDATVRLTDAAGDTRSSGEPLTGHAQAAEFAIQWLQSRGELRRADGVGHRIVHGGPRYRRAVPIDDDVRREIAAVADLAPLHNPGALAAIDASRRSLPRLPMAAVFDTAFHRDLPPRAGQYALGADVAQRRCGWCTWST